MFSFVVTEKKNQGYFTKYWSGNSWSSKIGILSKNEWKCLEIWHLFGYFDHHCNSLSFYDLLKHASINCKSRKTEKFPNDWFVYLIAFCCWNI